MANKIITVLEADAVTQTDVVSMDVGRQAAAASISHTWATEDKAVADAIVTALGLVGTQTTSAAILAKLSADPATQTTLAAILAKIIAAPATEAKQDTLITSAQLIDDTITAQGTALGSTKTSLQGGSVTTSAPTYTTGQISPLSMDTSGALRVTGAGGGTQYTEDAAAAADPVGNMLVAVRRDTLSASEVSADGDNIALKATSKGKLHTAAQLMIGDVAVDTGVGAATSATPRVVIANDSQTASVANNADAVASSSNLLNTPTVSYLFGYNGTAYDRLQVDSAKNLKVIDASVLTDDAAFTPATSKVNVSGFQADETSTDSVDEGDAGAARMTLDRKIITAPHPHTKGGLLAFNSLDLDETEEDIKTSPGQVYWINATNRTTSVRYLRFYNATAANVTVGSTATFFGPITIPANASDYTVLLSGFGGMGIEFDTAISASVTTGFAANDTGAPGTNDVIVNILYK